jgi:hypothetical protein
VAADKDHGDDVTVAVRDPGPQLERLWQPAQEGRHEIGLVERLAVGELLRSRRGDSNPGPLHYE